MAAATATAIAVVIGTGLAFSLREGRLATSFAQLGVSAAIGLGGVALLFALRDRRRRAFAASLLVLASGGEILWRNAASSLNAEPVDRYSVFASMKPGDAAGIAMLRREIAAKTHDRRPSARRDSRPSRALAERLDGAEARKYGRL